MNEQRVLDRFLTYVQIDSPTKSERKFAEHLMKELDRLGISYEMDNAGEIVGSDCGNLICRLPGNCEGETILFSSHMDTVSPGIGVKPKIVDGNIYSDGTTVLGGDDKAGVAAIMEGIESIIENNTPHADIEISFSIYEEGGLLGSKHLDFSKFKSKKAYVLDSGGAPGQIITSGPSQNKINATFIGKAAHAGVSPEQGISAIQILSEAISNMPLLRIDEETTANIGKIEGGEVTNIVTEKASFTSEARSRDAKKLEIQTQKMVDACNNAATKFGGTVELTIKNTYAAFKIDENDDIVTAVKNACLAIDLKPFTASSGGGSDTNNFNKNGIKAVNLGIGQQKVHTVNEFLPIEHLNNSARMVEEIIKQFAKK